VQSRDLARGVWWNVGSLAVAGALGLVFNALIAYVYGAPALGVFNQVFAVYIVVTQLGALGVHYSVLKHVAAAPEAERATIATTGIVVAGALGAVFALLLYLGSDAYGWIAESPRVAVGLRWAAPGVLFFALSKVTLSVLNAVQHMRWYAILFGGRFVLMVAAFGVCVALRADVADLPVILTIAEAITLLVSLVAIRAYLARPDLARWGREHMRFGVKGFGSGMLSELNTRVDIMILGYFASDAVVGAYSYATIPAEGVYQLLIALRTNYAPIIIRGLAEQRHADLAATIRRVRDRTYLAALAVGAVAVLGYALVIPATTTDPAVAESWTYFGVLIAGMVASAGYVPFQPLLLYGGFPGWHTNLMFGIVVANAVLNLALIPVLGALGSALGTALAFVVGVILLRSMSARRLGLRI
jgi:O-antigen/teichoic acid export membrane protein